ncbi:phage terminase small subunit-related protein [Bacillus thuringiensis]|uniref:phage terminase small subunit-related protein n=2 Tax=Bacillus thuringiensis TaxID=1428 RepID=UPI0020D26F06|nr:phage terminase small subunit-related protein [Bacillus thuringiensis]
MARQRSPDRNKAYEIFKEHNGDITNRKISELLSTSEKTVSEKTVGGWKSKDGWIDQLNGVLHKNERSTPKKDTEYSKKKPGAPKGNKNAINNRGGAKKGNKNAVGNPGGSAPPGNKNAVTHGLYATIVYENLSEEDKRLFDLSQDIEGQEQELQVARFKLAKLMENQQKRRLVGGDLIEYKLKDDFYTAAIVKALDTISKIETRISKATMEREKLELQKAEHEKKLALMQAQIDKYKSDTDKKHLGQSTVKQGEIAQKINSSNDALDLAMKLFEKVQENKGSE